MTEINRLLRHIFAPVVAWLVMNGYLPEYMQGDVTELFVMVAAVGIPYAISWWRDAWRNR